MTPPIFLDTNVQVYAAGRPHALQEPCLQILTLVAGRPAAFITDAEVLQELLHRYLALRLWEPQGKRSLGSFAELMKERVEPIYAPDVEQAAVLAGQFPGMEARDLLHTAVMKRLGISQIVSADAGFDRLVEVKRLDPAQVATWQHRLLQ